MGARHAVLLTPPKSSRPTQLLFYQHNASVSPVFATLTSHSQLIENSATLSPFPATLRASAPVSPLFATLPQTAGVSHHLFPFWNSPLWSLALTRRSPLLHCFHTLTNSFAFLKFITPLLSCNYKLLCKNNRGRGIPSSSALPRGQFVFLNSRKTDHPPSCYTGRRSLN
jgi:hypothetical protein